MIEYSLSELTELISQNGLKEGDIFETTSGKVIYYNQRLNWLSEKGYILSPLYVSEETTDLKYVVKEKVKTFKSEPPLDEVAVQVSNYKKLSYDDAYKINVEYHLDNKCSALDIAERYGISDRMVYYVANGTYWSEAHEQFKTDYSWSLK